MADTLHQQKCFTWQSGRFVPQHKHLSRKDDITHVSGGNDGLVVRQVPQIMGTGMQQLPCRSQRLHPCQLGQIHIEPCRHRQECPCHRPVSSLVGPLSNPCQPAWCSSLWLVEEADQDRFGQHCLQMTASCILHLNVAVIPMLVDAVACTMRFGSTAKVLLKCNLKYYRISECAWPIPWPASCPSLSYCTGWHEFRLTQETGPFPGQLSVAPSLCQHS